VDRHHTGMDPGSDKGGRTVSSAENKTTMGVPQLGSMGRSGGQGAKAPWS